MQGDLRRQAALLELGDSPLEASKERLDVERPTRDALDQRLGRQLRSVRVEIRREPIAQRLQVTVRELRVQVVVDVVRVDELRSVEVADRVRREIAELAERPVHVLQAAVARFFRADAQVAPI